MQYPNADYFGMIVPQEVYGTDPIFLPCPPIQFFNNGKFGIPLSDALASNFFGLADAHQAIVLNEGGVRATIRVNVCCITIIELILINDHVVVLFPPVARVHELGTVGLCLRK